MGIFSSFKITRLKPDDKISLISNLSTMLAAGIPILEAIDALLDETKGDTRKVLQVLSVDLKAGNRMYVSMQKFPDVFDSVTVSLVKAAEEAGTLEVTLKDIRMSIQRDSEFSDKIRSATTYPMIVMVVFISVMLGIILFVIPRVATVFERLNLDLPLPTRIMIGISTFLTTQWLFVILFLSASAAIIATLYNYKRNWFTSVFFSMPVINKMVQLIDVTRFTHSMHLLLNAGIPITSALELAEKVVLKKNVRAILTHARLGVSSGETFSQGLKGYRGIIPGIVVKLIEVGERSGTLAESMKDISAFLDYRVEKKLKAVTDLLEPLMLVFVGLAVGVMMLSVIAPMYGVITNVVN